jgi:hypothetical protein
VDAVAEAQVVVDRAVDVEAVAVGEVAVVAVGRRVEQEHGAARRHLLAVPLHVFGDVPGLHGRRGLEAQDLLDGARDQPAVGGQLGPLVGVLGQHLAGPADEPGGGLVAGRRDEVDVVEHLVPPEPALRAGLVLELGLQELGHEVVARVLGPPVDVGLELRARGLVGQVGDVVGQGPVVAHAEAGVDRVADGLLVGLRDAEQHADRAHRHLRAEVLDEVEAAGAHEGVEAVGAELAHLRLDGGHLAGREHAREEAAVAVVPGGILEDEHARRHVDVGLDQLEERALGGGVGAGVEEAPLHVVEPAEREEPVLVVAVEGVLVPQPAPHRVRVGIDLEVVRVVVDLGSGCGHSGPLPAADEIQITLLEEARSHRTGRVRPCASG